MKHRILLLLALITLLLTGIAGAARADQDSPKEMLIERVKNSQINYFDINEGLEGSFAITVKDFKGLQDLGVPAKGLEGSGLKLDGSLNTLQKKLQVDVTGNYDNKQYEGSFYVDGNRFIMTRDFLDVALLVDPSLLTGIDPDSINRYLYADVPELKDFWAALETMDSQKIIPVYREMLLFMLEAVPDKYFAYSGGNIVLSLDKDGLEEVIASVMLKAVLEQDRAADIMADLVAASAPSSDREELEREIGGMLGDLAASGDKGPMSPGNIKEALAVLNLEKLVVEASPDPAGKVSVDLACEIKDADFSVGLALRSDLTGSRATELKSEYSLEFAVEGDGNSIAGSYSGEYSQKGGALKEEDTFKLNMNIEGQEVGVTALINADMKENSRAGVNIPALTGANSTDLDKLTAAAKHPEVEAPVRVFLDGKPVNFDVPPYMKDGRVMVPVRGLAEALGYAVAWKEPNQVIITRDDFTVIMYVNERQYTANGQKMWMDISPEEKEGRNMVPLRFIVEEMGCGVNYNADTGRVDIFTNR